MSVTSMAAVFAANIPEMKTDDGKVVPDSTAKFVLLAMADNAGEYGENCYSGVRKLCQKTNFSSSTVCNALNALRTNKFVSLVGKSKADTNNYTINLELLNSLRFQPPKHRDSSHRNTGVLATETEPSINHQIKPSDDMQEAIAEGNRKMDAFLALSQAPGIKREARLNDILSYLGVTFRRNTSTKEWLIFAKYIDSEFQTKGWDVKQFVSWLFGQKGYAPEFWPVKKMMEFYPSAFVEDEKIEYTRLL